METILPNITNKSTGELTFYDLEESIIQISYELMKEALLFHLTQLDKKVIEPYLADGWEVEHKAKRTLMLTFGKIELVRTRLRRKNKSERRDQKSFIPLDQELGLLKGKQFSPLLMEKASRLAAMTPYRQASEIYELLTEVKISHMTIHSCVQEAGKLVEKYRPIVQNIVEEKRSPRVLFIEGDGIHIGNQEVKGKTHELHRFVIHEGAQENKKRRELLQRHDIVAYSSKEGFKEVLTYLEQHYDLSESIILTNSDGGVGYSPETFINQFGHRYMRHEHFTDPYHVYQMIRRKLSFNPLCLRELREAVKAYDLDRVELILDTAECIESAEGDNNNVKKLNELRQYLMRHWEYIEPMSNRAIGCDRGIGVCESGHKMITHRMKHQGRNWTESGAINMVNMLVSIRNGNFKSILRASSIHSEEVSEASREEITIAMRTILKKGPFEPHLGIYSASIPNYGPTSSPIGKLKISLSS